MTLTSKSALLILNELVETSGSIQNASHGRRDMINQSSLVNTYLVICQLTIDSCFSVHNRVMEHAGSLESTKEA